MTQNNDLMDIMSKACGRPLFLAEIGTFFEHNTLKAKKIIKLIAEQRDKQSAVPVILKGEVLHSADICLNGTAVMEQYLSKEGKVIRENYRKLIERKVVSLEAYEEIFVYARSFDFPLILSVYDVEGASFAAAQGACALKIASSNVRHAQLQRMVAGLGLPVILDDGRSPLSYVATAVERLRKHGAARILLEHSPDGHPALPEAHNLRIIESYKAAFGTPVGLSDHYTGPDMLLAATAMGYDLLEKGVALDDQADDQDVSMSLPVSSLGEILKRIGHIALARGDSWRDASKAVKGNLSTSSHMGLVAGVDLTAGDRIDESTVYFAFPHVDDGIGVELWETVEGWKINGHLAKGVPLRWRDVTPVNKS